VVVIVVRRCAHFVVVVGLDSSSFLCSCVDDRLFLAIIDRNGYMLSPLKKEALRHFIGLKISNLFWQPLPVQMRL